MVVPLEKTATRTFGGVARTTGNLHRPISCTQTVLCATCAARDLQVPVTLRALAVVVKPTVPRLMDTFTAEGRAVPTVTGTANLAAGLVAPHPRAVTARETATALPIASPRRHISAVPQETAKADPRGGPVTERAETRQLSALRGRRKQHRTLSQEVDKIHNGPPPNARQAQRSSAPIEEVQTSVHQGLEGQGTHAGRKQRDKEKVANLQQQTARQRANEGLRSYALPESRMPVSRRLEAWKLLAGSFRPPETGFGSFELALESPEWCFDLCYRSGGRILRRTLAGGVIHPTCTIWFEPGPDGTPFTRLVVGLKHAVKHISQTQAAALAETWLNIRDWRDSGSKQIMHNGIRSASHAVQKDGLMPRFMRAVQPASTAQPAAAQPVLPPLRSGSCGKVLEELRARAWANEESRLRLEIQGRMGVNHSPAELTQAMTSWFHGARSSWRRDQMAYFAMQLWCSRTASDPRAAEHAAAEEWYNGLFCDPPGDMDDKDQRLPNLNSG
ncbi:hypothetical protein MFIFM68171_05528 [Madurella fahalii]|uniref:Uncharacterized protein n=1 Tax=Madurella fahalii TaxID=1157608 RepID=A0ABQ0GC25_9PEZI